MKKMSPIFIMTAACLWATMGIFVRKFNQDGLFAMEIIEIRCIVTCLIVAIGILFYDRSLFKIKLKDWWCFFGTGVIGISFFNFCYYKTTEVTDLAVAAILLYTAPIFVMLISTVAFKEKLTKVKIISLLVAFIGCMLVSGVLSGSAVLSPKGFIIGISSGIGYALYTVFSKVAVGKGYSTLTITVYTFLFGSIGGAFFTSFSTIGTYIETKGSWGIIFCIIFAVVTTVGANNLYSYGLKHVESSKASVMAFIEPMMSTVIGLLIFDEIPSASGFVGIGLIICALCLLNINVFRRKTGIEVDKD